MNSNSNKHPTADDRALYAQALREAQKDLSGRDPGLWAIAFSMTDGDPIRCQAEYVRQRVTMLKESKTVHTNYSTSDHYSASRSTKRFRTIFIMVITGCVMSAAIAVVILYVQPSDPKYVAKKALAAVACGDAVTFFNNTHVAGSDFQQQFEAAPASTKRLLADAELAKNADLKNYGAKLIHAKILRTEKTDTGLVVVFQTSDGEANPVELRRVNNKWKVWLD